MTLSVLPWALLGYLSGSIPFGYVLTRLFAGRDIRKEGSGNIGATNVSRTLGWKGGVATMVLDIAKGSVPVALAAHFHPHPLAAGAAGLGAVLGHCYPLFLGFRGGKAVATSLGVFLVLAPLPCAAAAGVFAGTILLTRYVSLGSILAAVSFPFLLLLFGKPEPTAVMAACIAGLIVWRHRENVGRLARGEERKFTGRKGW
jgi:glycerol-3-phosphate acyltransferase PlsY